MKYYVYIIYSKSIDKYYIGYTADIETRIKKHNTGATRSTKPGKPWELLYFETFDIKREAIQRELAIKRMKSRIYIEKLLISSAS